MKTTCLDTSYRIYKLDMSLTYTPVLSSDTAEAAIDQLNRMGKKFGWKFVEDQSLFGGYWVAPSGVCYRVAGHDLNRGA